MESLSEDCNNLVYKYQTIRNFSVKQFGANMSRSTVRNQLFLNDGTGVKLPISTGTFVTSAVNIDEHKRLSFTIGITGSTGTALVPTGGFTGTLVVQGTNELGQCNGATGTQEAGNTNRPGINGFTGARFWNTLASGSFNIDNTTTSLLIQFTDVGVAYVRLGFNLTSNNVPATTAIGSGTMHIYLTAKNT